MVEGSIGIGIPWDPMNANLMGVGGFTFNEGGQKNIAWVPPSRDLAHTKNDDGVT